MGYQPFLIAPFATGLDTDLEPWIAPEDAFQEIENAHIRHGRVEKREGFLKIGDIVHKNGTDWDISGVTQADPGVVTVTDTTGLTDGDEIEIRDVDGMTELNGNRYYVAGLTGTTFELNDADGNNIDTSGFTAYSANGGVYLVPNDRVVGLERFVDSANVKDLLAFDTKRAAIYNTNTDQFDPLDTGDIFSGDADDLIWAANWASTAPGSSPLYRLYFTNGVSNAGGATDGIRYYDPATSTTATTQYNPNINGSTEIRGCKLIFAYKQRLLLLYTYEGGNSFPQRMRWCQAQNPNDANAWDDNVAGKGGFVDAPTGDQIISAQFVQNFIVVFFTNSVWAILPTSNPALPFRWEKINNFRACDSKWGSTGYDRYAVSVGNRGISATDGTETRRIDERIEDFMKTDVNQTVIDLLFMRRSYENRRTWLLYPSSESSLDETDKALIYDEESGAFSKYDISLTCLGYGGVANDRTWDEFPDTQAGIGDFELPETFADAGNDRWTSYVEDASRENFLGGNSTGTVFKLETGPSDAGNEIEMTLVSSGWNPFIKESVEAQFGYLDVLIETDPNAQITFEFYKDNQWSPYKTSTINCLPKLDEIAEITGITKAANASINSGNHGVENGEEIYIYGVKGMVEINGGPYTATVSSSDPNNFTINLDSTGFTSYTEGGVITKNPFVSTKVWKRVYCGAIGYNHYVKITSSGSQDVVIFDAFCPWFKRRGRRVI